MWMRRGKAPSFVAAVVVVDVVEDVGRDGRRRAMKPVPVERRVPVRVMMPLTDSERWEDRARTEEGGEVVVESALLLLLSLVEGERRVRQS